MKRSPGECFMCKTVQEVRYFDLYVIGSEGCHLCLPCELKVVEMVRQAAGQALQEKKEDFLVKRGKTLQYSIDLGVKVVQEALVNSMFPCKSCSMMRGLDSEGLCQGCLTKFEYRKSKPKNAFTGTVSG